MATTLNTWPSVAGGEDRLSKTNASPGSAGTTSEKNAPSTLAVAKAISTKYQNLGSWQATFTQESYSVGLGLASFAEGDFAFSPPDRFRFSLQGGDSSDFYSNGKQAWYIQHIKGRGQPALVQEFSHINESELQRYLFLLRGFRIQNEKDLAKIQKDFKILGATPGPELVLSLDALRPSDISNVEIRFLNKGSAPEKIVIVDSVGNKKTIVLKSWKMLNPQEAKQIRYEPVIPKGSTIERRGASS